LIFQEPKIWRPGSFTKNFRWGNRKSDGFIALHETINIGFNGEIQAVRRDEFRRRVRSFGRIDLIPVNFFLMNKIIEGESWLLPDELVFNAILFPHNSDFDNLAFSVFCMSYVGHYKGAKAGQDFPSLWSKHYISDQVAKNNWSLDQVTANDIERFLKNSNNYKAKTSRKVATNLNYIIQLFDHKTYISDRLSRWWANALFACLDRISLFDANAADSLNISLTNLAKINFIGISGKTSIEKKLAIPHLIKLYHQCGGINRYDEDFVNSLDVEFEQSNSSNPIVAIHPKNVANKKTMPRYCANLAKLAGFHVINADFLSEFDERTFNIENVNKAIQYLVQQGLTPNVDPEEFMKLLRGRNDSNN